MAALFQPPSSRMAVRRDNSSAEVRDSRHAQARAHALLKSKETELRSAREAVAAENAAELARAHDEAAVAARELQRVRLKA